MSSRHHPKMFVHDLATLELLVVEVNDRPVEFGHVLQELSLNYLNSPMGYLAVLADSSLELLLAFFLLNAIEVLVSQLRHDLAGFFIVELIIILFSGTLGSLLLLLLLLLDDDLVAHRLLHDDVVEDVPQQGVLHFEFSCSSVLADEWPLYDARIYSGRACPQIGGVHHRS